MKLLRPSLRFVAALSVASYRLAAVFVAALAVAFANILKLVGYEPIVALGVNTLTSLIPDAFAALDVVSRELVGFIPSVARNSSADRVAVGQTLRAHQTAKNTAGRDITPAMGFPAAADQTVGNKTLTITKQRAFPFSWTGEEQKAINTGPGFLTVKQDQIAQAIRAAVNEIEVDLAVAAYLGASRAYGTAGTTPYATNLGESAQLKKILDDNGAPSDRSHILNTTAGAALRTLLNNPLNANAALNAPITAQGILLDLNGFKFRESAQVQLPAIGTSNNAGTVNAAGYAVGTTTFTVSAAGTGTIVAGDIVTFAGDTNKYVVVSGVANLAAGGTLVIAAPGLLVAMSAATKTITVVGASTRNIGLSRNALVLGTRLPTVPEEGDFAILRETLTDDRSGLSFELAAYPGYRMMEYEISIVWGTLAMKPEHIAVLLG